MVPPSGRPPETGHFFPPVYFPRVSNRFSAIPQDTGHHREADVDGGVKVESTRRIKNQGKRSRPFCEGYSVIFKIRKLELGY